MDKQSHHIYLCGLDYLSIYIANVHGVNSLRPSDAYIRQQN